jgi:IS4 transposase
MSKPKRNSSAFRPTLEANLRRIEGDLQDADLTALARQSGFLKRLPRKIPVLKFVLALVALAAETVLSLERIADVIGLAAQSSYSKQALHQRLGLPLQHFLAQVASVLFGLLSLPLGHQGWLKPFGRVLIHDSTVEALPEHLAAAFPGASNGRHRRFASFKIQFVFDLLHSRALHVGLSGYTRNDQAAAPDILAFLQKGDLVIRDLGYFVLQTFRKIIDQGAYFLSRWRPGMLLFDPQSGQPLQLGDLLRLGQGLDRPVLLGNERLPVRLVAIPLPETVANQRRHQARHSRDRRSPPSQHKLWLLSWNLFITNVELAVWPPQAIQGIYRLRWRIEMIFKAWKSHLRLRELNCRTADLLRLSVMTKLLFCIAVYRCCDALELLGDDQHHVSLLRLARILGQCADWFAATCLGLSEARWLDEQLRRQFYEPRKDRKNFYELLGQIQACLT